MIVQCALLKCYTMHTVRAKWPLEKNAGRSVGCLLHFRIGAIYQHYCIMCITDNFCRMIVILTRLPSVWVASSTVDSAKPQMKREIKELLEKEIWIKKCRQQVSSIVQLEEDGSGRTVWRQMVGLWQDINQLSNIISVPWLRYQYHRSYNFT